MLYYDKTKRAASESTIKTVTSALSAKARFSRAQHEVFVRIGTHGGCIYLDLCDDAWRAVKISADSWEVVSNPPVRFRRVRGMQPLPEPSRGGGIDQLRPFLNVSSDDQWVLVVSWLVAACRPSGPYPVLIFEGSHGTAKSTASRLLRQLIDPNSAPSRFAPRDPRDLMIAARNGWCQSFDNISGIPGWLSDAFCRLATGGGYSTRRLYSDDGEALFDVTRPILITGIDVNVSRGDLLDRGIVTSLPAIANTNRITEAEFWSRFETIRPAALGGLLTAVSGALRRLPVVRLPELPRMADFVTWVTAAEPALGWHEGTMLAAYNRNRRASGELALEASPLVPVFEMLLDQGQGHWNGTSKELFDRLWESAHSAIDTRDWPRNPQQFSASVRRLVPNLRDAGIEVQFGQTSGSRSKKTISLSRIASG